jgi:hypothetical protein
MTMTFKVCKINDAYVRRLLKPISSASLVFMRAKIKPLQSGNYLPKNSRLAMNKFSQRTLEATWNHVRIRRSCVYIIAIYFPRRLSSEN